MKDKQIEKLIKLERNRQKSVINLIASENYVSGDVLKALGSELTNKYAEGYSVHRYYGGNEISDKIENLCKARALKLFRFSPLGGALMFRLSLVLLRISLSILASYLWEELLWACLLRMEAT